MNDTRIARWSARAAFPAAMALGLGVLVAPSASASGPVSALFSYSPHTQTWIVPAGVTSVHAVIDGAAGGRGAAPEGETYGGGGGGAGAQVTTDLLVTPGQVLTIAVGQGGSDGRPLSSGGGGGGGTGIEPGGNGGSPDNFFAGGGGGGGGASAIFSGTTALAVAGGGGGGGGGADVNGVHGGNGGTASAGAGADGSGTGHGAGGAGGAASGPAGDNGWNAPAVSFAGGGGGGGGGWPKGGAAGGAGGVGPGTGGGGGAGASGVDPSRTARTTLGTSPLTASVAADGRVTLTYQPAGLPTVTTVTVSPAAPVYGQTVTLTIRVTSGGQPVDTDNRILVSDFDSAFLPSIGLPPSVEFCFPAGQLGSAGQDGTATCTLANPASGGHDWYVHFTDLDGTYASSTGDVVVHVDQASTTTTLTSSSPTTLFGQPITLTATVARAASAGDGLSTDSAGTVTFRDGSTMLCQDVTGRSDQPSAFDCALPAGLPGGGHDLTATWTPDAAHSGFDPSTGSLHQNVSPAATQIDLASSAPDGSDFGAPVTFLATVAGGVPGAGLPDGTVQFSVDGAALGSPVALANATASSPPVPDLTPGTHAVAAYYSGDASNLPAGPADLAQVVRPGTTSVTVTSSAPAGTALGAPVTFTAAVAPVVPTSTPATGSVQFTVDGKPFGSPVPLNGGSAHTAAISGLAPGAHTVTAAYAGDSNYASATSPALTQLVDAGALAVTTPQSQGLAVTVPTVVAHTTVTGPVTVSPGASIALTGATINGAVWIDGASAVRICGTTIRGPVVITGTTGPVLIGDPHSRVTGCAGNIFWGSVTVVGGNGGTVFDGNRVHGALTISGGRISTRIGGNTVSRSLACWTNSPRPVNGGRPNTVSGVRLGQCAGRHF